MRMMRIRRSNLNMRKRENTRRLFLFPPAPPLPHSLRTNGISHASSTPMNTRKASKQFHPFLYQRFLPGLLHLIRMISSERKMMVKKLSLRNHHVASRCSEESLE